jgi:phosphate transport system substrate-binding protein
MRRIQYTLFAVVVMLSMLLSACSAATPTAAPTAAAAQPTSDSAAVSTQPTAAPAAAAAPTNTPEPTAIPAGSIDLNGSGATFPLPVYAEWTYAYQYVDPAVVINYQGTGSGAGKKAIIDGTVDFAGSDSFLKDEEYTAGKDLQMYPMLAGAVVVIYNIEKLPADAPVLVLDGKTLADIYNAKINMWNDPAIVALNPGLKDSLPAKKITVVHRADGSGTTEIFTKSMTSFSPDWKAGGASSVEWPVDKAGNGIGGKGNPGVAAAVQNTPNSLGYVELSYAVSNKIAYASMVNKAGKTVKAEAKSINAAMADFADKFSDKLTNTIVDAPGADSWPMAAYTYLVLHTTSMKDCVKASKLLAYVRWTLTDPGAAKLASTLGYSVLPDAVQKTVLAKLGGVSCNGAPVK